MYSAILARSFNKNEKRKLGIWAFFSCFFIGFTFCILLKSYYRSPLPVLNIQHSRGTASKMQWIKSTNNDQKKSVASNAGKWDAHDLESRVTNSSKESNDQETRATNSSEKSDSQDQTTIVTSSTVEIDNHDQKARVTNSLRKSVEVIQGTKIKPLLVPICKFSEPRSDFCEINDEDIRIQGNYSNIFIISSHRLSKNISAEDGSWRIRPYARKPDSFAMSSVREFSVKPSAYSSEEAIPECTKNHSIPGIVFSVGGYSGNTYHDFADILVPLYITTRHFNGKVKFLVAIDNKPWWLQKYRILLTALSKYDIIDINRDREIHCFRSMIVGLKAHDEFGFDPSRPGPDGIHTMPSFTRFLRRVYSLERDTMPKLKDEEERKARLFILARMKTRTFVNVDELATEARSLGYDVEVAEAGGSVEQFSKILNSFDVLLTVHGAGLTNTVFLPQRAVVIQVVPLGLEWDAEHDFELPARAMNLRYLKYKISVNESTLIEKYPVDHPVIRDPLLYRKQGWVVFKTIYLVAQNVSLDISKFRTTLLKALELLHE
ncbi:hypothetical protein Ancab_038678 [Ancistrocladus abbreviatus]